MPNKLQCYLGRVQKSCQNFLTYFRLLLPLNIRRGRAIYWNLKARPLLDDTFFIFVLDDTNRVQSDFKLAPDTDWTFRQYFISFAHNLDFLESQACHTISLSMVLNIYKFLSYFTTFRSIFITPVNFPRTTIGRNGLLGCDRCVLKLLTQLTFYSIYISLGRDLIDPFQNHFLPLKIFSREVHRSGTARILSSISWNQVTN